MQPVRLVQLVEQGREEEVLRSAPTGLGSDGLEQVQAIMGVPDEDLAPITAGVQEATADTTTLSVVVAIVSASSFARTLGRMYAQAWHLPSHRGMRAFRSSVVWLVVWVVAMQAAGLLARWSGDVPVGGRVSSLAVQLVAGTLIWLWSAHLLLGGRVGWVPLLPGAVVTAVLLVVFRHLSQLLMPTYVQANLDQFSSLGIVFAVASWLVVFGGVLVVATVAGRLGSELLGASAARLLRLRGRPGPRSA